MKTNKENFGIALSDLKAGDWFECSHGYTTVQWYVLSVRDGNITAGTPEWLSTSTQVFDQKFLVEANFRYLGQGKLKWWWRFFPWKDLICPFYAPVKKENV